MPGTPTTRWGLRKPALADSADVPRDIGQLADDCDSFAKDAQGLLSARPAAAATGYGRYYFATDTGELYRDDGGTWRRIHPPTDGTVVTAMLANAAATDAKLASPNNGVYRRIARAAMLVTGSAAASTYYAGEDGTAMLASSSSSMALLDLRAADLAVTGLTARLRLHAAILTNNTAPGINFTFGLYQIVTLAGGAGTLTMTPTTAAVTVAINAPGANLGTAGNSADIALPADGYYVLGVVTSGITAANSLQRLIWQVDVRNT